MNTETESCKFFPTMPHEDYGERVETLLSTYQVKSKELMRVTELAETSNKTKEQLKKEKDDRQNRRKLVLDIDRKSIIEKRKESIKKERQKDKKAMNDVRNSILKLPGKNPLFGDFGGVGRISGIGAKNSIRNSIRNSFFKDPSLLDFQYGRGLTTENIEEDPDTEPWKEQKYPGGIIVFNDYGDFVNSEDSRYV